MLPQVALQQKGGHLNTALHLEGRRLVSLPAENVRVVVKHGLDRVGDLALFGHPLVQAIEPASLDEVFPTLPRPALLGRHMVADHVEDQLLLRLGQPETHQDGPRHLDAPPSMGRGLIHPTAGLPEVV